LSGWQDYLRDPENGCDAKEKPAPFGAYAFFVLTHL